MRNPGKIRMLQGERLILRPLTEADVTDQYIAWLNDPEVNRFLETRFERHDAATVARFVRDKMDSPTDHLFGMFLDHGQRHIGNIKLGPVNVHHATAPISLFIGDKTAWGKGYAQEAIALVTRFGFMDKGLHKLEAGCYEHNHGSRRAFEKCGFLVEGTLKSHRISEGERTDVILLGLTRDRWISTHATDS